MLHYRLSVLSGLAAVPLICLATPLASRWGDMRLKHTWHAVPENWGSLGPPLPGTMIDLRIALKPHHENALIDTLYEVSTPNHPRHVSASLPCARISSRESLLWCRYGMHLSREEVADIVAPHPDTLKLVKSWLPRLRRALLFLLIDTRRQLAKGLFCPRVSSQ
jgi:tripeptidyl-peptidase-1